MEFLNIIKKLIQTHADNCLVRKNGTLLLAPGKIPTCEHMLFPALKDEFYQEHLVSKYKNTFPKEYLHILKHINGANMCNIRLKTSKHIFAHPLFVIFGLPITPPFARHPEMEEPYDLRIEDLARHPKLPTTWLKCGTYTKDYEFNIQYDIFVDTVTNQVYACVKNEKDIVQSWSSLDVCFCDIYNSFANRKIEYNYEYNLGIQA